MTTFLFDLFIYVCCCSCFFRVPSYQNQNQIKPFQFCQKNHCGFCEKSHFIFIFTFMHRPPELLAIAVREYYCYLFIMLYIWTCSKLCLADDGFYSRNIYKAIYKNRLRADFLQVCLAYFFVYDRKLQKSPEEQFFSSWRFWKKKYFSYL